MSQYLILVVTYWLIDMQNFDAIQLIKVLHMQIILHGIYKATTLRKKSKAYCYRKS